MHRRSLCAPALPPLLLATSLPRLLWKGRGSCLHALRLLFPAAADTIDPPRPRPPHHSACNSRVTGQSLCWSQSEWANHPLECENVLFLCSSFHGKFTDVLIKLLQFKVQPAVATVFLLAATSPDVTTTPLGTTMTSFCPASTDSTWTLTGGALLRLAEKKQTQKHSYWVMENGSLEIQTSQPSRYPVRRTESSDHLRPLSVFRCW